MTDHLTPYSFKDVICRRIVQVDMELKTLATAAGIGQATLSEWLNNDGPLSAAHFEALCLVLDLDLVGARVKVKRNGKRLGSRALKRNGTNQASAGKFA